MKRDLVSVCDFKKDEIIKIFLMSWKLKNKKIKHEYKLLRGKTLGMIFQKPSTRTRVSFEVGMQQLGGHPLFLSARELQLRRGETIGDTAMTLSRYVDLIAIRANSHEDVIELAKYASVPVINALSDTEHPCQILSDIFTIVEKLKIKSKMDIFRLDDEFILNDIKVTFIGDGNNILNSLLLAGAMFGIRLTACTPPQYEPDKDIVRKSKKIAAKTGAIIEISNDPVNSVKDSNVIYTDVWVSMGMEEEAEKRLKVFKPYQVNQKLVSRAKKDVIIMHCLPAHRGEEITAEVIDGDRSIVFDQAENRLHVQKGIMLFLLGKNI